MKRKFLRVLVVIILGILCFSLTGCGEKNEDSISKPNDKKAISNVVKIGDYVDYQVESGKEYTSKTGKDGSGYSAIQVFETKENMKWRVMSIEENGTVNLVSEKVVATKNEKEYYLAGVWGYLNAVDELNNICAIYGTGECATGARSMTVRDVNELIGIENYANELNIDLTQYNSKDEQWEAIYKGLNSNYGESIAKLVGDGNMQQQVTDRNSETGYREVSEVTDKVTDKISNIKKPSDGDNYYDLANYNNKREILELIGEDFWLADTGLIGPTSFDRYGFYGVYNLSKVGPNNHSLAIRSFACTNAKVNFSTSPAEKNVRPVVSLSNSTKVIEGTGTASDPYKIKK